MPDRKPHVLIVDDNLEMARTLAESLCDRDFAAVAIGSGAAAEDYLKSEKVDALVTNLRMPTVTGSICLPSRAAWPPSAPSSS